MQLLKRMKKTSLIFAVMWIVSGILMIIFAEKMINWVCYLIGGLLVLTAIIEFIDALAISKNKAGFVSALVYLVLGVLVMTLAPFILTRKIFYFLLGIFYLIKGFNAMRTSITNRKLGGRGWWIDCLCGAVLFALGVILTLNYAYTDQNKHWLFIIGGVTLVCDGLFYFISTLLVASKIKNSHLYYTLDVDVDYEIEDDVERIEAEKKSDKVKNKTKEKNNIK